MPPFWVIDRDGNLAAVRPDHEWNKLEAALESPGSAGNPRFGILALILLFVLGGVRFCA
ncbi:MAG: hypothetical protein ABIR80_07865 [Opitutaceae bacterium]